MTSSSEDTIELNDGAPCTSDHDSSLLNSNRTVLLAPFIASIPSEIDVFGFYLEPKQFCITILLATIMLGFGGSKFISPLIILLQIPFLSVNINLATFCCWTWMPNNIAIVFIMVLGLYTISQRRQSPLSNQGTRSRAVRWRRNGSNIKGLKDLPQTPQGGWCV